MNALILLLSLLTAPVACDRVDVIELNTILDSQYKPSFTQLIFWTVNKGRVCVLSKVFIETVSTFDPEVRDRDIVPMNARKGLTILKRKGHP